MITAEPAYRRSNSSTFDWVRLPGTPKPSATPSVASLGPDEQEKAEKAEKPALLTAETPTAVPVAGTHHLVELVASLLLTKGHIAYTQLDAYRPYVLNRTGQKAALPCLQCCNGSSQI